MSDTFCRIRGLNFAYDPGVSILSIDELNLEKGKITAFRGQNGSGKTTLLKILGGLLPVSDGSVVFSGNRRSVLVQQEPYLFQGSVRQNLIYPLKFRGGVKRNDLSEKIAEVLDFVGLKGFEKRKARLLSGGEIKRVAIARALMAESSVLMLDEPNANVDRASSLALENLLFRLQEKGVSIVLSTHDDRLAYRVSHKIIDLENGTPVSHFETIQKGEYEYRDGMYSYFRTDGITLSCPSRQGEYLTAVISPGDILLSKDRMDKREYNQLEGVIEDISPGGTDHHIVTINCGFTIRIPVAGAAFQKLEPIRGTKLFAQFSPSAIHLY